LPPFTKSLALDITVRPKPGGGPCRRNVATPPPCPVL
jgi:hypothetical protein